MIGKDDSPLSDDDLAIPHAPYHSVTDAAISGRYGAVSIAEGAERSQSRDLAWRLENRPIELILVPRLAAASPRLGVRSVEGLSLVHVDLPSCSGAKLVAKRRLDMVLSPVSLLLLSPVFLAVAIMIKLDNGVLFRQQRVGRFGEPFTIRKFRTICSGADSKIAANGGAALLFKVEDGPPITKIGKALREYLIDERPRVWTAPRGGMSVVSPSPQVDPEVAEHSGIHDRRLLIELGIAGLWHVNGHSELSADEASIDEAIRLDLRCFENWPLVGNITIMLRTVRVTLRSDVRTDSARCRRRQRAHRGQPPQHRHQHLPPHHATSMSSGTCILTS